MLFRVHFDTTVELPADQVAGRIGRLVIDEKFFSDRRGQILFHGVVSPEQFALIPCVVEILFGSIRPYPIRVQGHLLSTDHGTKIEAVAQMTDTFYLAFGLPLLAIAVMFAYETVIAPSLVFAWIVLFLPMILLFLGVALLYAQVRLRRTMRVLQEGVLKP